jgi:hypothetical protein
LLLTKKSTLMQKNFLNLSVDRQLNEIESDILIRKVLIDPALATELLKGNVANRTLTKSKVNKYATDMRSGNWVADTAECIKISHNMRLLDGQHRLQAIVESNTRVQMFIAYNVPEIAMNNIDTGFSRTTKNIFELNGISNAQHISAAIKKYLAYKTFKYNDGVNDPVKQMQITNKQALDEYNSRQKFWSEITTKFMSYRKTFKNIEITYLIAWYALAHDKDTNVADIYFNTFLSGLGLISDKDPIYLLRQYIIEKCKTNNRALNFALFVKSWNLVRKKQTVSILRYITTEKYPTMI